MHIRDGQNSNPVRVRIGKRTVKQGEAVSVWDRRGNHQVVVGPCLLYLWFSVLRFLTRRTASASQQLHIENVDGTVEYLRGPCQIWECPGVIHKKIQVMDATYLATNDDVCVVRQENSRLEVMKGPQLFFPSPCQTLVSFPWRDNDVHVLHTSEQQLCFPIVTPALEFSVCITFTVKDILLLSANPTNIKGDLFLALTQDLAFVDILVLFESKEMEAFSNHPHIDLLLKSHGLELFSLGFAGLTKTKEVLAREKEQADAHLQLVQREANAELNQKLADLELLGEEKRVERHAELKKKKMEELVEFLNRLGKLGIDLNKVLPDALKSHPQTMNGIGAQMVEMLD